MKYPEIEDFPMIMMYWKYYGILMQNKDPEHRKETCWNMIKYARPAMEEAKEYNRQYRQARKEAAEHFDIEYREPEYFPVVTVEPFKQYSIICEKEGNIPEAVWACRQAISLGFIADGTKGGMQGRLDKLMRKYNATH